MIRKSFIALLTLLVAGTAMAEPMRTRLAKENKMPEQLGMEAGTFLDIIDMSTLDRDEWAVTPYFRLGLLDNLAATVGVPYRNVDLVTETNRGLGDLEFGLEFLAYEDIFSYPWIMPHLEVSIDTGDEKEGLGAGESILTGGVAVGTTTIVGAKLVNQLHWIADGMYEFHDNTDNTWAVVLAGIMDLDEKFSLTLESQIRDKQAVEGLDDEASTPILILGGFSYRINNNALFTIYGGTESSSEREAIGGSKIAISF